MKGDHSASAQRRRGLKRRRDGEGTSAPHAEDSSDDDVEFVGLVPCVPKQEPAARIDFDEYFNRDVSFNPEMQQVPPAIDRNCENPTFDETDTKNNVQLVGATRNGSNSDGISLHMLVKRLKEMLIYLGSDYTHLMGKIYYLLAIRDEKLNAEDVIAFLKTFLIINTARKFRLSTESIGYTKSSKKRATEFLSILKFVLLNLESPQMQEFQNEIENKIENIGAVEKVILVVDAQEAIQQILSTFSSS